MEFIVIGIATAFNFTIIIKKLRMKRIADAILDCSLFTAICFLFSGTFGALATGAIASALISLYLLWNPFSISEIIGPSSKDMRRTSHNHNSNNNGRNTKIANFTERRSAYII